MRRKKGGREGSREGVVREHFENGEMVLRRIPTGKRCCSTSFKSRVPDHPVQKDEVL